MPNKKQVSDEIKSFPFDPGFIGHLSAFVPNIQLMYNTLAQYGNFNRKKLQFKMYYPKILALLKNYMSFYLGCLLWAVYIKSFSNADINGNLCYGGAYSEAETLEEVDFIKNYLEQLKKDAKYYIGQNFEPDERYIKILNAYGEFLKLNEGFVKVQKTDDIKLPDGLKPVKNLDEIKKKIDESIETDLSVLLELFDKVL